MSAVNGFVKQTVCLSRDGEIVVIVVTAQTTNCPGLVITPAAILQDGRPAFTGGLTLTHTFTGYRIASSESGYSLTDLADRLVEFDWKFSDPDHFTKPENASRLDEIRNIYWAWMKDDAYKGPVHFSDDSDEVKAAREKDPAGTLLAEHIQWWMRHSKALMSDGSEIPSWDENPKARQAELAVSVEGYGLIYLLAVLRAIKPQIADIAARDLIINWEAGDSLGEWVWQWCDELSSGKPLTLNGIPRGDPLTDFLEPLLYHRGRGPAVTALGGSPPPMCTCGHAFHTGPCEWVCDCGVCYCSCADGELDGDR